MPELVRAGNRPCMRMRAPRDLMPWNRTRPLAWSDVVAVVTRPPGDEGWLAGLLWRRERRGPAVAGPRFDR